jgi:adenine-specific DNA-methyltransferase
MGSKRKQLAFIHDAVASLRLDDRALDRRITSGSAVAVDLFSGSGVVARMLRMCGFSVHANDIEDYTVPINRAWLQCDVSDLDAMFKEPSAWLRKGRDVREATPYLEVLRILNEPATPGRRFFSKHYAPASTKDPDFHTERLFYTQENATRIDIWMECLHDPFWVEHQLARSILMSNVLYEMSYHINTSGTMKGFHHGWGGPAQDALRRIMAPLVLRALPFIHAPRGSVSRLDAIEVAKLYREPVDLVYLDPPCFQEQYGSNYHLLNTFCRNGDFDPGPVGNGSRAGIRRDHQRSAFGSTRLAERAFNALVQEWSGKTRNMLVSYDEHGILPWKNIVEILANDGKNKITPLVSTDGYKHTVFLVRTNARQSAHERSRLLAGVRDTVYASNADNYIAPERLPDCFSLEPHATGWHVNYRGGRVFSVGLDRLIRNIDLQLIGADVSKIRLAELSLDERFQIYINEGLWAAALQLLGTLKGRRRGDLFDVYSTALTKVLEDRGSPRSILRLERLKNSVQKNQTR